MLQPAAGIRWEAILATSGSQSSDSPRFEVDERPPLLSTLGNGAQFSLIASATLLVTPVVVANASGLDDSYLTWMVFASLLVVGVSTLIQVRRFGPVGGGMVLPMFTAAFSIPFCIAAVVDGGPGTLGALVLISAITQLAISRWLFLLRRLVTPIVGGTIIMILSITLASVVFDLLDSASVVEPIPATLTALVTLVVIAALSLRGSAILRLWGPLIGIVIGGLVALAVGIYDFDRVTQSAWVGVPAELPELGFNLGIPFWTLLPSFVFLGIVISIQANGASVALQRASWREDKAIDFRQVQATLAGGGVTNVIASVFGAVPNVINPGTLSFVQTTGVAARGMGYCIGLIFIALAFVPKVSGLLSTIPGPVMTGYLVMVTGSLFVDGARTVIQSETNGNKVAVAGVCFWIGASFQFGLFNLPDLGPVVNALMKSGITTGGFAAIAMILYLELTNPRRMRFESALHIDALPDLNEFMARFAERRGWDDAMKNRLTAVAEETLLTLAPLDLDDLDGSGSDKETGQLVVVAASEGQIAELEFIGGSSDEMNIEDRARQLQQHDIDYVVENELSLQLLRAYASSVRHQQFSGADLITVRVAPPNG